MASFGIQPNCLVSLPKTKIPTVFSFPRDKSILISCTEVGGGGGGGAGSPSHNALRINYIINRRWSRDLLVVSGVHGFTGNPHIRLKYE